MIIRYSQIIHSQIIDLKEQQNLGQVLEVVLNKTEPSVKALIIRTRPILPIKKVIDFSDVVEMATNAVLVNNDTAIAELNESIRVREALRDKYFGIGQKVYTKSNNRVGTTYDYTVHGETGQILKFYVKSLFSDRLISCASVIKIEGKKITIEDDFELIKGGATIQAEIA